MGTVFLKQYKNMYTKQEIPVETLHEDNYSPRRWGKKKSKYVDILMLILKPSKLKSLGIFTS